MVMKRNILGFIEVLKSEHPDWWNCSYALHIGAAREEIKQLREYIKELEYALEQSTQTKDVL